MHLKACVIGLGYIGLPTAAMLADCGCEVAGVDASEQVRNLLLSKRTNFEEPGLDQLLQRVLEKRTLEIVSAPQQADFFLLAVQTPYSGTLSKSCDLTYLIRAITDIVPFLKKGDTVIVESTVAPGAIINTVKPIIEETGFKVGADIYLAHCPERVMPGRILEELQQTNRLIGGVTPACADKAISLYRCFVKGEMIKTDVKTAEMVKCVENTFRDINIAFANELEKICYDLDIGCLDVIKLANQHPRVSIHSPGPGVGGHCLAVDPYFICAAAPTQANLIATGRSVNESMPDFVADRIEGLIGHMHTPKIAALGISYKGNVGDIRESPALQVVEKLVERGYDVSLYDPYVTRPDCKDFIQAITGADLAVVLTDHDVFKRIDWKELKAKMRTPMLFDTKNIVCLSDESGIILVNYNNLHQFKRGADA